MSMENVQTAPGLPPGESLTVEFKSDRNRLHDDELVEALACLANTHGGELWLGVEDDGQPTGLHDAHRNLAGLPGVVAAHTSPALAVTVETVEISGVRVGAHRGATGGFRSGDHGRQVSAPPHPAGRIAGVRADAAA